MPLTPVSWLGEITINVDAGNETEPTITHLANGNILVAWTSDWDFGGPGDPIGLDILGQFLDPFGNPIGGEFRVNDNITADDEANAQVAALPGGGFITVFEMYDGYHRNIAIQTSDSSGVATFEDWIYLDSASGSAPNGINPKVAVFSDTSALTVWREVEDATNSRILGRFFDASTGTIGAATMPLIDLPGNSSGPDVAALTDGNFVVTATHNNGGDSEIVVTIVDGAGTGWTVASAIASTSGNGENDREASVTALTGGGFVVAWSNTDVDNTDIVFQVFQYRGGLVGSPVTVTQNGTADDANEPVVVALRDGGFLVFYDEDFEANMSVHRFDASGDPIGQEFVIAAGLLNDQIEAELLADGRVAVTYVEANGEIGFKILDSRDGPNDPAVYGPVPYRIGTRGDDVFLTTSENFTTESYGYIGDDRFVLSELYFSGDFDGGDGDGDHIDASEVGNYQVTIDLAAGIYIDFGGQFDLVSVENATGGQMDDTITGNNGANTLHGEDGDDILDGRGGADTLTGGADDDHYYVDHASDVVQEAVGGGADRVYATIAYTLTAGAEVETLLAHDAAAGTAIYLYGNEFSQHVTGNAGDNILDGKAGADTHAGLGGNDRYYVEDAGDLITEAVGGGADRVYTTIAYTLTAGAEVENLIARDAAATTAIYLYGNEFAQRLTANAGDNILDGKAGADTHAGLGGNDRYYVDHTGDVVQEAVGGGADRVYTTVNHTLTANSEIETFLARDAAATTVLTLTGNTFGQRITGNAGLNVIYGKLGNDALVGLGGADNFIFDTALGAGNVDTITDFSHADDTIRLDDAIFTGLTAGAYITAVQFHVGASAADAFDRIIYNNATGALSFDADGSGAGAAQQFAQLTAGLALATNDFYVI